MFSYFFENVFVRWTPEGRLYYERWNNFKRYLTDISVLKDQTPDSLETWNSYLVYATSFGIAKEVLRSMSLIVPAEQLRQCHYYDTYYNYGQLNSGFVEAYSSSSPGGGGDGEGAGGGSGGGGGGAG